jgi:hypothetical protein
MCRSNCPSVVPLALISVFSNGACGDDSSGEQTDVVEVAPVVVTPRADPIADESVNDTEPPRFLGVSQVEMTGWGRLHLEWSSAVDNQTPSHRIRYRLVGTDPEGGSAVPPHEELTQPGAIEHDLAVPANYTRWEVSAVDEAGNGSEPEVLNLMTRPRLRELLTGAVQGELRNCTSDRNHGYLCAGTNGRYASWDGETWTESSLPLLETLTARRRDGSAAVLFSLQDQYRRNRGETYELVEQRGDDGPVGNVRRIAFEPSGLDLWLDAAGEVWATPGNGFRRLDDPLLLGPEEPCSTLIDLTFIGDAGFAWCEDGRQFSVRIEDGGYRWSRLADDDGLAAEQQPQRDYVFGIGRQLSALTWAGEIWRYDMGGWRRLLDSREFPGPATAMSSSEERGRILAAVGSRILAINALGEAEVLAEVPLAPPIIFLEDRPGGSLAITAQGGVFRYDEGDIIRPAPPTGYSQIVEGAHHTLFGILVSSPTPGIFTPRTGNWMLDQMPVLPEEFVAHAYYRDADGSLLVAGDAGEAGGQILRITAGMAAVEPFLYPPPAPEVEDTPPEIPEPDGITVPEEFVDPLTLLIGVPPETFEVPPPPPPPVRAIAGDPLTGRLIAVGEGGTIWFHIEGGWLQINSGLLTPLLSIHLLDEHNYLVGGSLNTVLACNLGLCEAGFSGIGDIHRFREVGTDLVAYGSTGVAQRLPDGTWAPIEFEFTQPAPSPEPPELVLAYASDDTNRWVLASDGSIWRDAGEGLQVMGEVEEPLDLWIQDDGSAVVLTAGAMYRLEP